MNRIKKTLLAMFLCLTILCFSMCSDDKKGKLEQILDVYIEHYKISKSEHFLSVGSTKWDDSTSVLVISFRYFAKDSLNLPKEVFKSYYKGINIYSNYITIPNLLSFEKIVTPQVEGRFMSSNEYFNDVQIEYSNKNNCILSVDGDYNNNNNTKEIVKEFKEKGLICN